MEAPCVFCRIIAEQLPAKVIEETNDLLVIQDISPKAPVHWLIMPKKHVADIQGLGEEDTALSASMVLMAKKLSEKLPGKKSFRLVVNNGHEAGQRVFHLHFHFLAGTQMEP